MLVDINGVKVTPLKKIEDDRGKLLHMMKTDTNIFERFEATSILRICFE